MADHLSTFQAIRIPPTQAQYQRPRSRGLGCGAWLIGPIIVFIGVYFFAPFKTNLILLGIDRAPKGTAVGRSDTMILMGVRPLAGKVSMLSIPRDLWINIPGWGENRINAVHFFAEADVPGSGPAAVLGVLNDQFEFPVSYYARIQLENFPAVIDALGGVTLVLDEPASIYPAGTYHLNGTEALAFARDRSSTDDFYRMAHGQILLKALVKQAISPKAWIRLPTAMLAIQKTVDTNIPSWLWPRLGFAILRSLPGGLDNRTLTRDEAVPSTTSSGANVLLPQWDKILPIVEEMFTP